MDGALVVPLQAPASSHLQQETRVVTVPADQVNDEINMRRIFGWNVQGTSARSYSTHATIVGGGISSNHLGVGAGQAVMHNTHLTDITLTRTLDPRRAPLRELEAKLDNLQWRGHPKFAGWAFVLGIVGFASGMARFWLPLDVEPATQVLLALIGAGVGVAGAIAIWVARKRKVDDYNASINQTSQNILTAARRYWT